MGNEKTRHTLCIENIIPHFYQETCFGPKAIKLPKGNPSLLRQLFNTNKSMCFFLGIDYSKPKLKEFQGNQLDLLFKP